MKNKLITALAVIAVIALISGAGILAATSIGTQSDPLVALSYLTDKFKPQILDELKGDIAKAEQTITQKVDSQVAEINTRLSSNQSGSAVQPTAADVFSVVTLTNGQKLTCSVGTEIMLRIGTAAGFGASAPALVNSTDGTTLSGGAALLTNNMYLITIEGNGVTATADTVRVLVRGNYTVG